MMLLHTQDCQFGTGDMWATHNSVISLISGLATFDLQDVTIAHNFDFVLVTAVKFLGSFIPGQCDFRVVNLDLTFKNSIFRNGSRLVCDITHHSDRLCSKQSKTRINSRTANHTHK